MRYPLRHARNRGTALVLVVVLSVIITGLILTLALGASVLAQTAPLQQQSEQAYYAAEAGLQMGIVQLKAGLYNRSPIAATDLALPSGALAGTYSVSFSNDANVLITSIGTSGSATCTLTCRALLAGGPPKPVILGGTYSGDNNTLVDAFDSRSGSYGADNRGADSLMITNTTANDGVAIDGSFQGNIQIGAGGDPTSVVNADGGELTGTASAQTTNVQIDPVSLPAGMPASAGNFKLDRSDTQTWFGGALHYDSLTMATNSVIYVTANTVVQVDGDFKLDGNTKIILQNNATLTIYVNDGNVTLDGNAAVNMDQDSNGNNTNATPSDLHLYLTGQNRTVKFLNHAGLSGYIENPDGMLKLDGNSAIYGSYVGQQVQMKNHSAIHVDVAGDGGGPSPYTLSVSSYSLVQ